MNSTGALYIVATPIGNLSDMTFRAVEVLKKVDVIAAEDTRHSAKLMQFYQIDTPLMSYHDHGGDAQTERVLNKLREGSSVALISDAGTPLISDPGYKLVYLARDEGLNVVPLPGPCAFVTALSAAGLPSNNFSFEGFPPAKTHARKNLFEGLAVDTRTLIFYESPHRIEATLADMCEVIGEDRQIVMAREITKSFETFLSGSLRDVQSRVSEDPNQRKGEIVLLLQGKPLKDSSDDLSDESVRVMKILADELPVKQASALASKLTGEKKNKLYQWALDQN